MNIYVVGQINKYAQWLDGKITSFEDADLVIFTGGADVLPTLYNDIAHSSTNYDGKRDAREISYFTRSLALDKKMLGICRGSQFLTVMNGGKLIQDVDNHAITGEHDFVAPGFGDGTITSTHHQMMYPYILPEDNYKVIGYPPENMSTYYRLGRCNIGKDLPEDFIEPEIVYYPKTNSLGIQGHPERMDRNSQGVETCRKIVNHYLID